jgi:hypothetical protein
MVSGFSTLDGNAKPFSEVIAQIYIPMCSA